ncbi:unnamed protein product [Ilex paraguariensis]|uniref:Uncharacterized protein n=1 Tax=Ilex paraguariensis TaxID=185542 RepID=A0ABC8TZ40_9AQUA
MGCFIACFGSSKQRKTRKPPTTSPSGDQRHKACEALQPTNLIKQEVIADTHKPIPDLRCKHQDQLNSNSRTKVTFNLNVKAYEGLATQEVASCLLEIEEEKEREKKEENQSESHTLSDSSLSSLFSYPPNPRYHNCTSSDEESIDMETKENDSDEKDDDCDDGTDHTFIKEESSESLFSLSIESRKQIDTAETEDKEVNSAVTINVSPGNEMKTFWPNRDARDRGHYVHSVLNPVENLSQWKAVKARTILTLNDDEKENFNLEKELNIPLSEEPNFKQSSHRSKQKTDHLKPQGHEIAIDTSLSSWLVESEKMPTSKNSPRSIGNSSSERGNSSKRFEDRPILGLLTVEELKKFSASSSPRQSPSCTADEKPIVGTVGSFWSLTGQGMDSDSVSSCKGGSGRSAMCKEGKRMNRLERDLDRGTSGILHL